MNLPSNDFVNYSENNFVNKLRSSILNLCPVIIRNFALPELKLSKAIDIVASV